MVSDDFSFPNITHQLPNLAVLPSLWRVSSLVHPSDCCQETNNNIGTEEDCYYRLTKSEEFSPSENYGSEVKNAYAECEEKMDILWEDFNEELKRVNSIGDKKKKEAAVKSSNGPCDSEAAASERMVDLCCLQALRMSRTGGRTIYARKSSNSLVLAFKFLKKLFLFSKSAPIKKND